MFGTYNPKEVTILLKDITGLVTPLDTRQREALIQRGVHYSEMLPLEYRPTPAYLETYQTALDRCAAITADAAAWVAEEIWREKGERAVLVSLARAGTPTGILIRRYLAWKYGAELEHYTLSIIRGRGIDRNAMDYILARHRPEQLQFVDGWTGKGAIQRELRRAMEDYPGVDPGLAVLSDPGCLAGKSGTQEDFLIPSSCLNATVSGLLSRTFYRPDIIRPGEFHGAAFYQELMDQDLTGQFIDTVSACFPRPRGPRPEGRVWSRSAGEEVEAIQARFGISDRNLVKPGVGEATRVLLRRLPWKVLVRDLQDGGDLGHLCQLAREKGVELVEYPLEHYRACGLIRSLADS